ncbi:MAG: hypothetical protein ACPL7D_10565, partial [Candidatus Sumerlaeaceae bacterium]
MGSVVKNIFRAVTLAAMVAVGVAWVGAAPEDENTGDQPDPGTAVAAPNAAGQVPTPAPVSSGAVSTNFQPAQVVEAQQPQPVGVAETGGAPTNSSVSSNVSSPTDTDAAPLPVEP